PAQKMPPGSAADAVEVTSGERFTPMTPRSVLPSPPPGGQSLDSPWELVVAHASVARAPRSQVANPGVAGDPVAEQRGQGRSGLRGRRAGEDRGRSIEAWPVPLSTVPLTGCAKVFTTQVESPPLGIGSGGPKLQPVSVQSTPPPLPSVGASRQSAPVHDPTS